VLLHLVVGALIVRHDAVLLCHRSPDRAWLPDVWHVPGGHIRAWESPRAALGRELEEELGIRAEIPATPHRLWTGPRMILGLYRVTTWTGSVRNRCPEEHIALHWFNAHTARTAPLADARLIPLLARLGK
jgi:8-oxo-dGTP diphosphatase